MPRYLITSALPYINGIKHLGNLVGSMLPADVYARYLRQCGHEVLYICATDEHGTPAELAAAEAGLPVAEYCQSQHEAQARIYRRYHLSFDHFGRSSSPENHELTQQIGNRLADNGLIEERIVKQAYSLADERFLPDRYVVGTCPHCGYERARGDQCENCTRLLDAADLIAPHSAIGGSPNIEFRDSRHLFFLQSQLSERLRDWILSQQEWPTLVTSIALKWLDEGLEDRSITRDLEWGVPVGRPGMEGKVYYVWFDAPIEYIGATREFYDIKDEPESWQSWWRNAADVRYTQFMAKDNIPFHTVMFPASLMGTHEPWKLADYIKGLNWMNYYGGKFSTSRRYGVFMDDALELLPADYWRYFLLANAPESGDSTFTWELFASQCNKDLAGILGNFVNRVCSFTDRQFGDCVPSQGKPGSAEEELGRVCADTLYRYESALNALQFRKALQALRTLWSHGNTYLELKAPWTAIKQDPESAAVTLRTALNLILLYAMVSAPVIPDTARRIGEVFGRPEASAAWPSREEVLSLSWVAPGDPLTVPEILFRKISDDDVAAWRDRFGGEAPI